jgi:hypothetical protein
MTGEMTLEDEFTAFRLQLEADERVLGLVLSGSQAREGVATAYSDYDLLVVVADDAHEELVGLTRRDERLDVSVMPLTEFRTHALPGSGAEWGRYGFVGAEVLKDVPGGLIAELVTAKTQLAPADAAELASSVLDAFLNSLYRSLKNDRDGNTLSARLDAAEALPPFLTYVFALNGRLRPYNKYLEWELRQRPLDQPEWQQDQLLEVLAGTVSPSATRALRQLFNTLEPYARAAGHGEILDAWGDDLILMRGTTELPGGGGNGD